MTGIFTNQVAVVTGASRGIGAATARAFAKAGAAVAVASRDEARLDALLAEITAAGGNALGVPTDISDPAAVERLVARTLDAFGRLDIAFNNAAGGGHPPTPLTDVPVEDFDSAFAVNLRGTFLCMQHEIAAMLDSGGGAIVNMTSTAGLEGVGGLAAYVSTKHGVVGLTKVAALEYAARGIRVNAVAPGPILADQLERAGAVAQQAAAQAMPMKRVGRPAEVASPSLGCAARAPRSSRARPSRSTAASWREWRHSRGRRLPRATIAKWRSGAERGGVGCVGRRGALTDASRLLPAGASVLGFLVRPSAGSLRLRSAVLRLPGLPGRESA